MTKDIRWVQRFSNFCKALERLENDVNLSGQRSLSELENLGLIKSFEFTFELAWNTLKDFLVNSGNQSIYGPVDAVKEAFKLGLLENGDIWMEIISSRNMTSHVYDEKVAENIINSIINKYLAEFLLLKQKLSKLKDNEQAEI